MYKTYSILLTKPKSFGKITFAVMVNLGRYAQVNRVRLKNSPFFRIHLRGDTDKRYIPQVLKGPSKTRRNYNAHHQSAYKARQGEAGLQIKVAYTRQLPPEARRMPFGYHAHA